MKRSNVVNTINALKGEEGHQKVLEVYNAQKPLPRGYKLQAKDPWCAATVSAVLILNGCEDIKDLAECSCPMMISNAKRLGIWVEDDAYIPKEGDVIMYDWQDSGNGDDQGTADHTGIVIKVGSKITVREGNKNKTVGNRTIDINSKYIRGYITPRYEADSDVLEGELTEIPSTEEKTVEEPQKAPYEVGKTYIVSVRSCLNVRKGPGMNFGVVGFNNLTIDAKKHAVGSALKNGTKVTCMEVKILSDEIWMRIPSGWICAKLWDKVYVK